MIVFLLIPKVQQHFFFLKNNRHIEHKQINANGIMKKI
jgi:hypothetical protein